MPLSTNFLRGFLLLASIGIVLGLLSWLQPVLIPVALAILLTFLLSPLVRMMERRHAPRAVSVLIVVLMAAVLVAGVGWIVARQVTGLVDSFPQYERNLTSRIASLQDGDSGFIDKLQAMVESISRQLQRKAPPAADSGRRTEPLPVTVVQEGGPFQLSRLWSVLGPVTQPFATVGLAVVLLIFMLIRREDLRDRVLSLVGHGRLTMTTKALDEAGERISRYLLLQLMVNSGFGTAVAVGLAVIGIPYAPLWGFIAGVLRYIPYLGAWLAALLPIGLSLLVSDTWTPTIMVVGLFLALDLVINMLIEPSLYGRGIGVSETAALVMVAFWTWLWGPIGLILATPLTVCLVVLGKYVPALNFFDTLLGDKPVLEAHIGYYQRLLARDQDEAADIVMEHLKTASLESTYDTLLVPALTYARRDLEREALSEDEHRFIVHATQEVAEELKTAHDNAARADATPAAEEPAALGTLRVFCCVARDETDEAGLAMLKQIMDPRAFELSFARSGLLASEVIEAVAEAQPDVVCIASIAPGGIAQTRLLCLRLRRRFAEMKILVGRWGGTGNAEKMQAQLIAAGADRIAITLTESSAQLAALRALLAPSSESVPEAKKSAPRVEVEAAEASPTPLTSLPHGELRQA